MKCKSENAFSAALETMRYGWAGSVLFSGIILQGIAGPLPEFTFKGVAKNPLGKYGLSYASHKHIAVSMAYSDSMDGAWTEYAGNPVIEGPSTPDIRWIEEKGTFYLWGQRTSARAELRTSDDGIHFESQGVSVTNKHVETLQSLRECSQSV